MKRIVSLRLPTVFGAILTVLAVVGLIATIASGRAMRASGDKQIVSTARIAALASAPPTTMVQSPDMASVQSAFANAAVVLQTMTVPPAATVNHSATAADLSSMQTNGMTELNKYFSPSLALQESSRLTNAMAALADPNLRVLGGGVSDVSYDNVLLSGNAATVTAHVTEWSRMAQIQGTKAVVVQPSNVLIVTSTLARVSAASPWIVTGFDWNFAPGSTP